VTAGDRPGRPAELVGAAPALEPVLDLAVDCGPPEEVGRVPGGVRRVIPITGGWFEGAGQFDIRGEILPGGADWNLQRDDWVFEACARYLLRTDDGALLTITNVGIFTIADGALCARTVARFEVAAEPYRWLTQSILVGHLVARDPFTGVDIRLHRVT
jgi:hypothetical protein